MQKKKKHVGGGGDSQVRVVEFLVKMRELVKLKTHPGV